MHYEIYGYSTVNVKEVKDGDETVLLYFNKKTVLCRETDDGFPYLKKKHIIKPKPYVYINMMEVRKVQQRFKKFWDIGLFIHVKKITKR